jgi:hypothetical protein
MSFALVSFSQTGPGRMPRPFEYTIPLPSAYAHSGSGPLCFELRVNSRTNASPVYFDYTQGGSTNPTPYTRSLGTGCRYTATGARVTLSASSGANWPQSSITMSMNGTNVRPNTLAYMTIGVTDETLGAIPLPFELPGTATSPSGACNVYNDILITIPTLANASGQTTTNLGVGVNPSFNGLNVYSQLISADAAANNWGLVLSNGVQFQIVAPFATGRIGEVYNNSSTGPTGTVRANGGMITMFH